MENKGKINFYCKKLKLLKKRGYICSINKLKEIKYGNVKGI